VPRMVSFFPVSGIPPRHRPFARANFPSTAPPVGGVPFFPPPIHRETSPKMRLRPRYAPRKAEKKTVYFTSAGPNVPPPPPKAEFFFCQSPVVPPPPGPQERGKGRLTGLGRNKNPAPNFFPLNREHPRVNFRFFRVPPPNCPPPPPGREKKFGPEPGKVPPCHPGPGGPEKSGPPPPSKPFFPRAPRFYFRTPGF